MPFETYHTHSTRGANKESRPIATIRSGSYSIAFNRAALLAMGINPGEQVVLEFDRMNGIVKVRKVTDEDPDGQKLSLNYDNPKPNLKLESRQSIVSIRGFATFFMIDLPKTKGRYDMSVSFKGSGTFVLPAGSWQRPQVPPPPVPPAVAQRFAAVRARSGPQATVAARLQERGGKE